MTLSTTLWRVDPADPDPALIGRAAQILRGGGLVAFPTETVYGLGANALNESAVRKIFAAKGRPSTNPLIVHVADGEQVGDVAAQWPATAAQLAQAFWPGPLTLVLPKQPRVPDIVTAGGPTVAVRCPNHPVARALLRQAGVPIAAPSANRSTELSPTRAEHVLKSLNGRIDAVLDGGPCPGGIESTVVDVTGEVVQLLRPGLITLPMLEALVGRVAQGRTGDTVARSPGQMAKHYCPRTPLLLANNADHADRIAWEFRQHGLRVIILGYDPVFEAPVLPNDPIAYAAALYDTLHQLDEQGYDRIVVVLPPDKPEWAAVRDRLMRAATR
jgi:L-threonylcarbamoyladenylate synthase